MNLNQIELQKENEQLEKENEQLASRRNDAIYQTIDFTNAAENTEKSLYFKQKNNNYIPSCTSLDEADSKNEAEKQDEDQGQSNIVSQEVHNQNERRQ